MSSSPEQLRNYVRNKLHNILTSNELPEKIYYNNDYHLLNENILNNIISNLEISIYNSCISSAKNNNIERYWSYEKDNRQFNQFRDLYKFKAISIIKNLDPDSTIKNTTLLKRLFFNTQNDVLESEFDNLKDISKKIHYLCNNMQPIEMFPEKYKDYLQEQKDYFNKMRKKEVVEEGLLKCGKCKSRRVTYYEMQTRSADKGLSQSIMFIVRYVVSLLV